MRISQALFTFVIAGFLGCSSDMMSGNCPAGMVACGASCVPAEQPCAVGQAALSDLSVSAGTLSPAFSDDTSMYMVTAPFFITQTQVTATADAGTSIEVSGAQVASGVASQPIPLGSGATTITVTARAAGKADRIYTIIVMRVPASDYIKAGNTEASDEFGISVAVSGDTLAVGAYFEDSNAIGVNGSGTDNSAMDSGAVYIFVRNGNTWTQQAYIKASNTGANDNFGASVSLSGDTLAVGAPGESSAATGVGGLQSDNTAGSSGAVYVFQRTGTTWVQQAYVKASNTAAADNFGCSVSITSDTLAVGAFGEDSNATGIGGNGNDNTFLESGAAYVFVRTGTTWVQQAYVKASNTGASDNFGRHVSLSGDTLAVAAPLEASNATGVGGAQNNDLAMASGAVYVFQRGASGWMQQAYLKASNTGANDNFGSDLSLSGDTLAVGAVGEASSATGINGNQTLDSEMNSGAVYVFARNGATWMQQAYIKASNTESGDQFGGSVSLSGDLLAVGAFGESSNATGINGSQSDNSAAGSGAAYVFQRSGTTWTQQSYVKASNTEMGDAFGYCLAISGSTLAVAATFEDSNATGINGSQSDNSAPGSGAVYILH